MNRGINTTKAKSSTTPISLASFATTYIISPPMINVALDKAKSFSSTFILLLVSYHKKSQKTFYNL